MGEDGYGGGYAAEGDAVGVFEEKVAGGGALIE